MTQASDGQMESCKTPQFFQKSWSSQLLWKYQRANAISFVKKI